MASAKLSPLLQDLIGSIDGTTYAHVKPVLVAKAKGYPGSVNPFTPSPSQITARENFAEGAANWKALDDADRAGWEALALTINWRNKYGDAYNPSGFWLYCQLMMNRKLIKGSIYDEPPAEPSINALSDIVLNCSYAPPSSIKIEFTGQTTDINTTHLIAFSGNENPGRSYPGDIFRNIGTIPPSTGDLYDATDEYLLLFPDVSPGKKIFCRLTPIDTATGFSTDHRFATDIVS